MVVSMIFTPLRTENGRFVYGVCQICTVRSVFRTSLQALIYNGLRHLVYGMYGMYGYFLRLRVRTRLNDL